MENIRRPDFTHALIHLTRERFESSDDFLIKPVRIGPFDVLKQMLTDRKVRAGSGLVKQSYKVVCLSECPLSSIHHLTIDISRYRPYGIAISKSAAFKRGARPVIYLPDEESAWIPRSEQWRLVRFEHGTVDYTAEREWRLLGDLDLSGVGYFVIVKTQVEANEIQRIAPAGMIAVLPLDLVGDFL